MKSMNFLLILLILGFTMTPNEGLSSSKKYCSQKELDNLQTKENFLESQNAIADEMTAKLEREFEKNDAQVVLLGNVGKDVSDRDIETPSNTDSQNNRYPNKYMHGGLAYKVPGTQEWKIIHLLNVYDNCGNMTAKSIISKEKLRTFFAYPNYKMDMEIQMPSKQLQKNLLKIIMNSPETLHESQYSAISNPKSIKYQNSNQFILELIATAQKESSICQKAIDTARLRGEVDARNQARQEAQLCAFAKGFIPASMNAKTYETIGVSLGLKPEISVNDHSLSSRIRSKYDWVSYPSLSDYLKKSDPWSSPKKEICPRIGCDRSKHELYVNYINQKSNEIFQTEEDHQTQ